MLHVVGAAAEGLADVVEVSLGKVALLHQLFDVKAVRLRRGDPAARGMELRQIPQLFQRGKLVAHGGGTDARQVLFGDALAGDGHGSVDVFVYNDL